MRKIAIVGFKGGIGKTTTAVSLGDALARRGRRVLIIDTDTQANVSLCLGITGYKDTLAEVLLRKAKAEATIVPARENLDILPADLRLFKAQQRMVLELARERILSDVLARVNGYDYQVLDCAPSVSVLTVNAIAYVQEVFVPVSMEMLAIAVHALFARCQPPYGVRGCDPADHPHFLRCAPSCQHYGAADPGQGVRLARHAPDPDRYQVVRGSR
jgi:chromosome partitioning protein